MTSQWARTGFVLATSVFACCTAGCRDQAAGDPKTPSGKETTTAPAEPAPAVMQVKVPLGLPPLQVPADNPMTTGKVELGKMLYFDKRLSKDGTVSCATCHEPKTGWTERRATSEGIGQQVGGRNAPTVINAAYLPVMFWDGRAATLEEQAVGPIENPVEMGHKMAELVVNLNAVPGYKEKFQAVFGTDANKDTIAKAIAAFERTVLSGNSPYDKYQAGDKSALTEQQVRGMELFNGKAECATCHAPPVFSNGKYYNAGIGTGKPDPDTGREKVTHRESDRGKFRVPHLRSVADTAPYFHDGSVETLDEAVRIMATGGIDNPNLSSTFKGLKEEKLTDAEIADITAFVKAGLAGEYPKTEPPAMP